MLGPYFSQRPDNPLHKFSAAGVLRPVMVHSSKVYFDTNAHEHHHFFIERENLLIDIPYAKIVGRDSARDR
jgi:Fur family transcriptional regulator, iron response regulator